MYIIINAQFFYRNVFEEITRNYIIKSNTDK